MKETTPLTRLHEKISWDITQGFWENLAKQIRQDAIAAKLPDSNLHAISFDKLKEGNGITIQSDDGKTTLFEIKQLSEKSQADHTPITVLAEPLFSWDKDKTIRLEKGEEVLIQIVGPNQARLAPENGSRQIQRPTKNSIGLNLVHEEEDRQQIDVILSRSNDRIAKWNVESEKLSKTRKNDLRTALGTALASVLIPLFTKKLAQLMPNEPLLSWIDTLAIFFSFWALFYEMNNRYLDKHLTEELIKNVSDDLKALTVGRSHEALKKINNFISNVENVRSVELQ